MIVLWGMTGDDPLGTVAAALERHGEPFAMIDQRDVLAMTVELAMGPPIGGTVTVRGETIELEAVGAAYLRQYDVRRLDEVVDGGPEVAARVAAVEAALWTWTEHTPARVFNRPSAMATNGSKPYQAALIEAVGFATPPTLITTDADVVRELWARHGTLIYKSVSAVRSIVSRLAPGDEERLRDVVTCPTQFQKYISGNDVRVHVVGDTVFPCLVESGADDYRYAARQGSSAELTACTLPPAIADRCRALSKRLGLPLAGIDLRLTPEGEWYCFEVNPSPGFTFYDSDEDQPIAGAIARLLAQSPAIER